MLKNSKSQATLVEIKLPLVTENDLNDYKCEGYALRAQSVIDNGIKDENLEYDEIVDEDIEEIGQEVSFYSKHFQKRAHYNFIGKLDASEQNLFVLSVKYDSDEQKCTLILRTKDGNLLKEVLINTKQVIGEINIENMFNIADLMQVFEKVPRDIKPVTYPMASKDIAAFDKHLFKKTFKFGIIYQKYGLISEKEILSNSDNSKEFEEFLEFIGQRVKLKNFKKFRGRLDVTNNTTGLESIYETYEGTEIMFHVSTFLAHLEKKADFVVRKRHIGNDRVAIVFQDRDTIFTPKSFPSTQIRVFMIIQPVIFDNETKRYKVSVISKKDVPDHRPEIPVPYVFKKDEKLKRFLLSKLINAEYACLHPQAKSEKKKEEKTEEKSSSPLSKLVDTLTNKSATFMSMSTPGSSSASLNPNATKTSPTMNSSSRLTTVRDRLRKFSTHYLKT